MWSWGWCGTPTIPGRWRQEAQGQPGLRETLSKNVLEKKAAMDSGIVKRKTSGSLQLQGVMARHMGLGTLVRVGRMRGHKSRRVLAALDGG